MRSCVKMKPCLPLSIGIVVTDIHGHVCSSRVSTLKLAPLFTLRVRNISRTAILRFLCSLQQPTPSVHSLYFTTMKGDKGALQPSSTRWEPIQRIGKQRNSTNTSAIQYPFPKGAQLKTQGSAGEQQIGIMYDTGDIQHE